ncbi:SCP2 sterol-binding domain-containing protein [Ornithinibacillus gellani]|uniref:SCP2 sterol-binding domain-containing protein n=1 Tax=Ornithinibacillus gellani TaxID=2293253 RepID=UPI000F47BA73|nr:SCP2 sterol-binding domain-containing protein [Ornithinibacillus gellani]TQS75347.1 SCP2 sterol-binding domain-containing protein [Ornithinibacillus gellani]
MGRIDQLTLEELKADIAQNLKSNPEPYKSLEAVYEFHVTDADVTYQLVFKDGSFTVHDTVVETAGCKLKMKEKYFRKFLIGDLNSTTAFMTGKLKIEGSIGLGLKLESILKQYDFS